MLTETIVQEENLLGRRNPGLKLRLAGSADQGRLITLEPGRCLIGTDPSCTVRLNENRGEGRRLGPFHCLIVQGAARTIVRRISPAMLLNGRHFSDAVLEPGDRLSVDSYEIEVLPSGTEGPAASTAAEIQHFQAEVERLNRVLAAQRASSQSHSDELQAELAKVQAQAARSAADREEAHQSLARRQATWEQTVARWEQEHRAWHAERLLKTAELTNASKRIQHLEGELARSTDRAVRLAQEAKAQAPQLEEARTTLRRLKADLARAQTELERERRGRQAELAEKAAELTSALGRSVRLEGDLAAANERLERLGSEHRAARDSFDQERAVWAIEREERSAELDEKSLELAAAVDRLSRLDADLSRANDEITRLTNDASSQTDLNNRTGEALERLQAEQAVAQASFEQERAAWQAEQGRQAVDLATAVELASSLEAELAAAKKQLERLATDSGEQVEDNIERQAELDRLAGQLAGLKRTLDREREAWTAERQALRNSVADAESRNAAFERRLAELIDEIESTRHTFAEERQQWEQIQANQESQLQQLPAETGLPLTGIASAGDEPIHLTPADSDPTDTEPSDSAPSDRGRTAVERTDYEPAEKQPTQTDELLARFGSVEPAEIAFHAPQSDAPVSTADLLSRFGLSAQHETPEPPPPVRAQAEELASESEDGVVPKTEAVDESEATAEPSHSQAHHDDKDSIDAYMAQLMARLGKPGYVAPQEEAPRRPEAATATAEPRSVQPVAAARSVPKLRDPSEIARRAMPPELTTDLSAMREIANQNARAAIDTHARRSLIEVWLSKAAVMLLGLIGAGVETWLAMEGSDLAGYFIVPSLMIGIFWGWQYLVMSKRLSSSRDAAPPPAEGASDADVSDQNPDA